MADAARVRVFGERGRERGVLGDGGIARGYPSISAGEFTGTTASIFGRRDRDTGVPTAGVI